MLSRIAWGFCNIAFEASRDGTFPDGMRRAFQRVGVAWFWVALTLDGRAFDMWRDYRAERVVRLQPRRGREDDASSSDASALPAWSLPNVGRITGLGLGRVWVVVCPYCQRFHTHAAEEGCRPAPCRVFGSPATYVLSYEGELPRGLWERFRLSIKAERPKLLRHPDLGALPPALEAA